MTTKNNAVLGYITCEAGGRATVHQAKRGNGLFLYTRCDCCGCDQRTGGAVQTRLFNSTEWLDGVPVAPPNLLTTEKQPQVEPESVVSSSVVQPDVQPEKEKVEEPIGSFGLFAALAAGFSILGLCLSRVAR